MKKIKMFLYPWKIATFYHNDEMRDLNEVQSLFLAVENYGDIQATVAIARITLAAHSKNGDSQKKRYLWKSSLSLSFFGCGGLENDDHKENDSEKYGKPPRQLSVTYKKKPLEDRGVR